MYIQNGAKVLKKLKYKKTGYQAVGIPKQKAETKLTFYVADKKGRSAYVTKEVQDVTPPSKPKIQFTFEDFVDSADDIHYSSIDVDDAGNKSKAVTTTVVKKEYTLY